MKRLAIFVEGQTEQLFVENLIMELAGRRHIKIEKRRASGGKKYGRSFSRIQSYRTPGKINYFIMIVDSSSDSRVVSDIREHYDSLKFRGYNKILGLRDIYPMHASDLRRLQKAHRRLLPKSTRELQVRIIFAVLEIETWFIAEHTHFNRMDHRLNNKMIRLELGFNPSDKNLEQKLCPEKDEYMTSPAQDLNKIYNLVGKSYSKKRGQVERIIHTLDYDFMLNHLHHIRGFQVLVDELDEFFSEY